MLSEECIRTRPLFEFLEGTLDGWPEMNTSRKNNRSQPSVEQNEKPHNCSNEIDIQQNVSNYVFRLCKLKTMTLLHFLIKIVTYYKYLKLLVLHKSKSPLIVHE